MEDHPLRGSACSQKMSQKTAQVRLTMVNDALVHEPLHDLDGSGSVRGLLMLKQPIDELLGHKAVWVSAEVVPSIFDHLGFMQAQSATKTCQKKSD